MKQPVRGLQELVSATGWLVMLSLAPDLGWVKESTQGPSEVRRGLAPKQGVWVSVSLWHRDLFILLISGHN